MGRLPVGADALGPAAPEELGGHRVGRCQPPRGGAAAVCPDGPAFPEGGGEKPPVLVTQPHTVVWTRLPARP